MSTLRTKLALKISRRLNKNIIAEENVDEDVSKRRRLNNEKKEVIDNKKAVEIGELVRLKRWGQVQKLVLSPPTREACLKCPDLIHQVCESGEMNLCTVLLESKVDIEQESTLYSNGTPLMCAARSCNIDLVEFLLKSGAKFDCKDSGGNSLLHVCNYFEVASFVVEHGANINALNFCNSSPLIRAVQRSNLGMVDFLLKSRADIYCGGFRGNSILHHVRDASVALSLLASGANINALNDANETPLISAVASFHSTDDVVPLLQVLVEHGANVNSVDRALNSAIHYACTSTSINCLFVLAKNGADLNMEGSPAVLYLASKLCYDDGEFIEAANDFMLCLLDAGANPNLLNSFGESALTHVIDFIDRFPEERDNIGIPTLVSLLAYGADDSIGCRPHNGYPQLSCRDYIMEYSDWGYGLYGRVESEKHEIILRGIRDEMSEVMVLEHVLCCIDRVEDNPPSRYRFNDPLLCFLVSCFHEVVDMRYVFSEIVIPMISKLRH